MRKIRSFWTPCLLLPLVVACVDGAGAADDPTDPEDDAFLVSGKSDAYGVEEGTADACGVLKLVNEASREVLDGDARLDRRAAANIVAYRSGPDGTAGTDDDERFDSLAELDDIKHVGRIAFGKLLRHSRARGYTCRDATLQILALADVHGQLDPVSVANVGNVGGAAALATHFQSARAANPNTLAVSAGDLFGASPPLSMYFEERPMVESANLWRLAANAVGNHELDRGLDHLRSMIERSRFPYISANLSNVRANVTCPSKPSARCIEPYVIVPVGGLKVALVGVTTPETPTLVKPGRLGTITITDPIAAANRARAQAAARGAQVFVLVAHIGGAAPAAAGGEPTGPIVELARGLRGFDAVIGGHTHTQISATINGIPVVENKSQSQTYARLTFTYDFATRSVTQRVATVETPLATVAPHPAVVDLLAPYRAELSAAFDVPVGIAAGLFERDGTVERLREVALGNLVADAIREHTGAKIAFVNGGGLRAPIPSSYAPADRALRRPAAGYAAGAPFDLVLGDVFAVLPFGNSVATQTVTGAQLWQMLEHSVDALPGAKGYFGQISGFRFTYDASKPVGSRVVSVTLDDGTPVPRDGSTYTMTTSDFIAAGGDGYAMLAGLRTETGDPMADILRDYIRARGTIAPATAGRITSVAP
jgi:5'-nucleotidase